MDLNLNELRSPDPGPRDGSILRLQQQHRSREVWEADHTRPVDSKKVRVRSAKKCIRGLPWPSPPVLELIRRARLEGLCSLPFVSVDWGLITALLERWRPETHTFHLRPGESTITLQDVEVLLGIPVEGKPVTGNTNLKPHDLCKRLLGEQPTEESDINGMKVKARGEKRHTMDLNLNELRSPDPGPRDGSILRLQQQHHSREVWEADSVKNLPHISSDCEFIFHTGGFVHLAFKL
ncbi:hypothetical protein RHMOL_Rhmol10G0103700 [Rhododendron molle]|uniref:Uncharacterized protein n=1 Tax=Rhododendron molle TaxID=49168 RepID=A0ACC0M1Z6_RHOML|nr:hypothetical protein RHMOL_Rhmol10G0103700 [Rhododendron molle]